MAKGSFGKRLEKTNNIISDEVIDEYEYNGKKDKKNRIKIIMLENAVDKDLPTILMEFGSYNLSLKEIAVLAKIPVTKLEGMLEKGRIDFNDEINSIERDMYVAYEYGKKSLEANAVASLMYKSPDKLLATINPEKYSDKVLDKYEMPNIVINITDKPVDVVIDDDKPEVEIDDVDYDNLK